MSRRLVVINVALGIVSVVLAVGIVRTVLAKQPLPQPPASRPVSASATAAPTAPGAAAAAVDGGPGAYGVISARNLFNPSRTESAPTPVAAAPVAKPILYGVIVDGAKSRAFLEDPTIKRVAGYSVGDKVGGGTIQKIAGDRVFLARPEGLLEILLQDPSKPRATPVAAPAQPGAAQAAPAQPGAAQAAPAPPAMPPIPGLPPGPLGRQRIPLQRQPGNE